MLSSFILKMIAVLAMVSDHIGLIFFPEITLFRIIGRMAAPLFAFILVQGFFNTKSRKKYLLRLAIFAFISEFAFDLFYYVHYLDRGKVSSIKAYLPHIFKSQNFIFSLLLGFIAMLICEKIKESKAPNILMIPSLALFCVIGQYLHIEYGFFGLMLISGFYLCNGNKYISSIIILMVELYAVWLNGEITQIYALLSIIPILLYSGEKGKLSLKYFFYIFYPAHLLILCLLKLFLLKMN